MHRETFRTSRLLDFLLRSCRAQTGHETADSRLVILKESIDNALDGCEETDTPPEVSIAVGNDSIAIEDNGPGIPATTVKSLLDFSVRVSSEAYVSPTRGIQGNALKTLIMMPFVYRVRIEAASRSKPWACAIMSTSLSTKSARCPSSATGPSRRDRENGTRLRIDVPIQQAQSCIRRAPAFYKSWMTTAGSTHI